uniref:Latent transforming growth factor beta binding protein 2 n=1 Tax=Astyanax mexicanus TaxID=7994 RepID=A0A3B1IHS0_ASTMX
MLADIDKCSLTPSICGPGQCVSVQTSYTCYCDPGYKLNGLQTTCIDVNECEDDPCGEKGHCANSYGSYTCQCFSGFSLLMTQNKKTCQGSNAFYYCRHQLLAVYGFFKVLNFLPVTVHEINFTDINECAIPNKCPNGVCVNTEGSFTCECKNGFTKNWRGQCEDINECQAAGMCANGRCVNTEGSFICTCNHGYQTTARNNSCQDVNECLLPDACPHGTCVNLPGSHRCRCYTGYQSSPDGKGCEDVDECAHHSLCVEGVCVNTAGSFTCTQCEVGYRLSEDRQRCEDVDECLILSMLCPQSGCTNTEGSYSCMNCDPGYRLSSDRHTCEAASDEGQRKECYYNLNDANLCENVLSHNATKQECCCTVGAGWGDNCEIHPCPVKGQAEYDWLCPRGSGLLSQNVLFIFTDVDECEMFGPEICKNGICSNYYSTFSCFCRNGYYYDNIRMACVDHDECKEENLCERGTCVNTDGSFNCFCSPPLVLDGTQRNCISINNTDGEFTISVSNEGVHEGLDEDVHTDICWQQVKQEICSDPMVGIPTTYTECCCLYGVAWGSQCAFCPKKTSGNKKSCLYAECSFVGRNEGFEGLRAEECGILNGCENGRCVRVREGYTCDCFDGYELDLSKMACIDINECKDISDSVELCKNGICSNTEGSYKCTCLPGFVASSKPHECIPEVQPPAPHAEGK